MAETGACVFVSGFSPVLHRPATAAASHKSTRRFSVMNPRAVLSTKQQERGTPSLSVSDNGSSRKKKESSTDSEKKKESSSADRDSEMEHLLSLKIDYLDQSRELMRSTSSDGGPPRWFSPLECGCGGSSYGSGSGSQSRFKDSPLLLFLPGMDGVGLGLVLHHKKLGEIFEVWCLHIPIMDRTPFTDLVVFVEETVRSENGRNPKRPIYLVGESFGGCLALAVGARNQDIDLLLILANPATCFHKSQLQSLVPLTEVMPEQLRTGLPHMLSLMTGFPSWMVMAMVENGLPFQQIIEALSQDALALSYYLSVLADTLSAETLPWKLKVLKSAAEYANSRLHAVKAQTLILSSGKDQLLPSQEEGERLRRALLKSEIRTFNEKGHALFLEDGFDLVTIIKGASFYRRGRSIDYVSDYLPPSPSEFNRTYEPFRWLEVAVNPVMLSTFENGEIVRGLAGVPSEGPVLLVGYHMMLGFELIPLVSRFWIEREILLRGIAHPMMFTRLRDGRLPDLSAYDTYRSMGAVPVSPSNLYKLFSSKSHVLLYPGGMREALHRKGEEYMLFWPEHSEFIRMAARFGAKIVPFGVVGEDDIGQLLLDYDDLMKIPYFRAGIEELTDEAVRLRTDSEGEVANQQVHLPIIAPKLPGRFYFFFGKPIETKGRKQELRSREKAHELYLEVKSEVERCISLLKEKREKDPYRNLLVRLFYQATHGFDTEVPTFEL